MTGKLPALFSVTGDRRFLTGDERTSPRPCTAGYLLRKTPPATVGKKMQLVATYDVADLFSYSNESIFVNVEANLKFELPYSFLPKKLGKVIM